MEEQETSTSGLSFTDLVALPLRFCMRVCYGPNKARNSDVALNQRLDKRCRQDVFSIHMCVDSTDDSDVLSEV